MKRRVGSVGTFDGVHRGHKSVLKALVDYAREHDLEAVAFTFGRHPLALIDPRREPQSLSMLPEKNRLLKETGVIPVVLDFNEEMKSTTTSQWMRQLKESHNVDVMVVGYDNTFGSDGLNYSIEDYRKIGKEIGIEVISAPEIKNVSSSLIRKKIGSGEVEEANGMLGRPYSISGKVIKGNRLGHTIGFPTANLLPPAGMVIPYRGVYAALVKVQDDDNLYNAMVNIGNRPTINGGGETVIESHLIDFDGDIYGKEIKINFLKRLREEKKFDTIEELKAQLEQDRAECQVAGPEC